MEVMKKEKQTQTESEGESQPLMNGSSLIFASFVKPNDKLEMEPANNLLGLR